MSPAKKKTAAKKKAPAKRTAKRKAVVVEVPTESLPASGSDTVAQPAEALPAVVPAAESAVQPGGEASTAIRSLTLIGAVITLAALVWGWQGLFSGIWSSLQTLLLLGLVALVLARYLPPGKPLAAKLPALLQHPLIPALLTLFVAARALQLARLSVTGILWVAAAALLLFDRYGQTKAKFAGGFAPANALKGMSALISAGVAICLVSLFFNWSTTAGYLYPNYGYTPYSGTVQYGVSTFYMPGVAFDGRGFGSSFIAISLLLGLLGLTMFARPPALSSWGKFIAPAAVALIFVWWVWAKFIADSDEGLGPWLFLVGLGLVGFAVVKTFLAKPATTPPPPPTAT